MRKIIIILCLCLPLCAWALEFSLPKKGNDVIGTMRKITVKSGQDVYDIAKKYQVGYLELLEANPDVNLDSLWPGQELTIPTRYILPKAPRKGIVINLSELRLYYYPPGKHIVFTYPIGIGKEGEETPIMKSKIIEKTVDPVWRPTKMTRQIAKERGIYLPKSVDPGPQNPLGPYALRLNPPNYLIHGNNESAGVGLRISGGCIRMYNHDIDVLFHGVKVGTPVDIVAQPFKTGWDGKTLYFEAHVPVDYKRKRAKYITKPAVRAIMREAKKRHAQINWDKALDAAQGQHGIPVPIGHV